MKLKFKKLKDYINRKEPIAGLVLKPEGFILTIIEKDNLIVKEIEKNNFEKQVSQIKKELSFFPSFIFSVPPENSYLQTFEFSLSLEEGQIKQALELSLDSLPFKKEEVYADWMEVKRDSRKKEILLMAIKKSTVDPYLELFKQNNLVPIALETYPLTISRFFEKEKVLVILNDKERVFFIVYDQKTPLLCFDIEKRIFGLKKLNEAIIYYAKRIIHFIFSQDKNIKIEKIILNDSNLKEVLKKETKVEVETFEKLSGLDFYKFLSVLAAKRGMMPRKKDKIISLMPIKTEVAYERYRLFTFVDFFQKLIIGFSLFLIILFSLTLIFVKNFNSNLESKLVQEQKISLNPEIKEIKEKAKNFNKIISLAIELSKKLPSYKKVFDELNDLMIAGVNFNYFKIDIVQNKIEIKGVASDRNSLILLKEKFLSSEIFEIEPLPLSLFLGNKNIVFSVKGKLKNLDILYQND